MYTLISPALNTILGYKLWGGFAENSNGYVLNDPAIVSIADQKATLPLMLIPTLEFAQSEAVRINKIIKERIGGRVEVFVLPVELVIRHLK